MNERYITAVMMDMGEKARKAVQSLTYTSAEQKNSALLFMAKHIDQGTEAILHANALDLLSATKRGMSGAAVDRLLLDKRRIAGIVTSLYQIAELDDLVGQVMSEWTRPNGINIRRVRTPIGVIGIIYESRPNVTAEASALCIKSGNAVILRGGSDAMETSRTLFSYLKQGLVEAGLPENAVQLVTQTDRGVVGAMLAGLNGNLDILIPRGGRGLIQRVREDAKVPVLDHQDGVCHLYIDKSADLTMAKSLVLNSKLRRTGICGATETLLIDKRLPTEYVTELVTALTDEGCEVRACPEIIAVLNDLDANKRVLPAASSDWGTEFLDAIISVAFVDGVDEAVSHIHRYSSGHTDGIVASDCMVVEKFFSGVNSAIVMHNTSTQFSDGGEFGFGGEIGISTSKLHARGPIGAEQLTTYKYQLYGNGQIRR